MLDAFVKGPRMTLPRRIHDGFGLAQLIFSVAPKEGFAMSTTNSAQVSGLAKVICQSAQHRLQDSSYRGLRRLTCEFSDGVLTLRGEVATYFLKQIAQTIAADIDGVDLIANHVQVPCGEQTLNRRFRGGH